MSLTKKFPTFQTVAWWIQELETFDKYAIVKLATNPGSPANCLLSIYGGDEKRPTVWIDIGEPE